MSFFSRWFGEKADSGDSDQVKSAKETKKTSGTNVKDNLVLLLNGYHSTVGDNINPPETKGYVAVIKSSNGQLLKEINDSGHAFGMPDDRYNVNVVAGGEKLYGVSFTKDWKVLSRYGTHEYGSRNVLVGAHVFLNPEWCFSDQQNVKQLLDDLFESHFSINEMYQLVKVNPIQDDVIQGLQSKISESSGSGIEIGHHTANKDYDHQFKKARYVTSSEEELEELLRSPYRKEFIDFRQVYLQAPGASYVKPHQDTKVLNNDSSLTISTPPPTS